MTVVQLLYSPVLAFYLYLGLKKLCSYVKNIMMNKMRKNHKLVLVTELIFCNNLKTNPVLLREPG